MVSFWAQFLENNVNLDNRRPGASIEMLRPASFARRGLSFIHVLLGQRYGSSSSYPAYQLCSRNLSWNAKQHSSN